MKIIKKLPTKTKIESIAKLGLTFDELESIRIALLMYSQDLKSDLDDTYEIDSYEDFKQQQIEYDNVLKMIGQFDQLTM